MSNGGQLHTVDTLNGWVRALLTGDPDESLEQRFFRLLCLVAAILSVLIITPVDVLLGLPWPPILGTLTFGLMMFLLYGESRKGRIYPKTGFVMQVLLLNGTWFTSNGSTGGVGLFFFAAVMYAMVFFRGRARLISVALVMADAISLLLIEYLHPSAVVQLNARERLDVVGASFIMSALLCAMMMWAVLRAYDAEQERQRRLNQLLTESLDETRSRTEELERTLAEVRQLRGLLPICARCKKIRSDQGLWTRVERYVSDHSGATFTHGLCPDCERTYLEEVEA